MAIHSSWIIFHHVPLNLIDPHHSGWKKSCTKRMVETLQIMGCLAPFWTGASDFAGPSTVLLFFSDRTMAAGFFWSWNMFFRLLDFFDHETCFFESRKINCPNFVHRIRWMIPIQWLNIFVHLVHKSYRSPW